MQSLHNSKLFVRAMLLNVLSPSLNSVKPDLTDVQFAALRYIRLHPDTSLHSFAEGLGISSPAATKLADRLSNRGWITRKAHKSDRRQWILQLTAEGKRLWLDVDSKQAELFSEILADLTEAERQQLSSGLRAFIRAAAKRGTKEELCLQCGEAKEDNCVLIHL